MNLYEPTILQINFSEPFPIGEVLDERYVFLKHTLFKSIPLIMILTSLPKYSVTNC